MEQDRIFIDDARKDKIRAIKGSGFLGFGNQKEVFMFALSNAVDVYNGQTLEGAKDGFFNTRDFNEYDKAIIRAAVYPYLERIEDLNNSDLIFKKAEGMANIGFSTVLDDMASMGKEVYLLNMLNKTNELYKDAKDNNLFDLE